MTEDERRWDPRRYIWEQISEDLEQRIRSGEIGPDFKLSEYALAAEYGVARHTIRRALKDLRERGIIITKKAKGSFPAERLPPPGGDILD